MLNRNIFKFFLSRISQFGRLTYIKADWLRVVIV